MSHQRKHLVSEVEEGHKECSLDWWCDTCKKIFCIECAPNLPMCPKCGQVMMHDD